MTKVSHKRKSKIASKDVRAVIKVDSSRARMCFEDDRERGSESARRY